jgi:hypothetical protein
VLARESLLKNQKMRRKRRLTLLQTAKRTTELKMLTPDRLTSNIKLQPRNRRRL